MVISGLLVGIGSIAPFVPPALAAGPDRTRTEPLPSPLASAETSLSCWGNIRFPIEALDAPAGAQDAIGPEYDALRREIDGRPDLKGLDWRTVIRTDHRVFFLADGGDSGWISTNVTEWYGSWRPDGFESCDLQVILGPDLDPAHWILDPAYPRPGADTSLLHLLVSEVGCAGWGGTYGRNAAPLVAYAQDSITITLGVRPLAGGATCPNPPGTPVTLTLAEPVGSRTLLDGALYPPRAPGSLDRIIEVERYRPSPSVGPG